MKISSRQPPDRRTATARALLLALALLEAGNGVAPAARAQTIYLRDGQSVQTQGLRRDGPTVLASIQTAAGSAGELGYPAANIARIDFPKPPQLKTAGDLLSAGKAGDAAGQLAPVVAYYGPFRDIPGNWWAPLALLQMDALTRLGRDREVEALATELTRAGAASPEILRTVKMKQAAALERRGEHQPALAALEPLVNDKSASADELVEGWLTVGTARLALRDYKEALLAFLHVPVYTPDRTLLMSRALLGSAEALIGLDDAPRAQAALKKLLADYPNSAEAATARERLQMLQARPPKRAGG